MNKHVFTVSVLGMSLLLGACSAFESKGNSADAAITPNSAQAANAPAVAGQPTSNVALKQKGQKLMATIVTNWNLQPQGYLYLNWKAPARSGCISSHFPIAKYKETNDKTWAVS